MTDRILIVEDEPDLADILAYQLGREGFEVRVAATGGEALRVARQAPAPDLVLLDLMLPDLPGTEVCRQLRADAATRSMAIVMATARGEEIDRVVGFELGADDYVVKPYSVRELILRIRAVLRRRGEQAAAEPAVLLLGALRIDGDQHRAWVAGAELELTALEFKLLTTLVSRRGRVQTREILLDQVWGVSSEVTTRTVDTHIKRLRQKLGAAGQDLQTVRGVGYRWRSEQDAPSP